MTKIRFLVDYRGVLTRERFYQAGDVADMGPAHVIPLIKAGRAERVTEPKPDLEDLPLETLREMAKDAGVSNYWLMKEERLISELRDE